MRFVLDSDVDEAGCRKALLAHGHEVLTARAGGVDAHDPDVTAYALGHGAVVVTADRVFTIRHREHPVVRHVRLRCPDPAAESVLMRSLPELGPLLEALNPITVVVSASSIKVWFPNGGTSHIDL